MAVVGGGDDDDARLANGEVFDPEAQTWQPLPSMARARSGHGLAAVAGGLVAVGGDISEVENPNEDEGGDVLDEDPEDMRDELFDEASGRWFELPHQMIQPRQDAHAVSLPAAALSPPAAGVGAANAAA